VLFIDTAHSKSEGKEDNNTVHSKSERKEDNNTVHSKSEGKEDNNTVHSKSEGKEDNNSTCFVLEDITAVENEKDRRQSKPQSHRVMALVQFPVEVAAMV